jgi:hypothetical protein
MSCAPAVVPGGEYFRLRIVGIVLLFASSAFAQQYTVTDLGTLGGEEDF